LIVIWKSHIATASCILAVLAATAPGQTKPSQPLVPAHEAVGRIMANDPESKIEMAEQAHAEHLKRFVGELGTEKPAALAARWLALVDEAIALPHRSFSGMMGGSPGQPVGTLFNVLIALPGPESWPHIKALVLKRPPSADRTAMLILMARLTGDDAGLIRLCDEYDRQMDTLHPENARYQRGSERESQSPKLDAYWRLGPGKFDNAARLALTAEDYLDVSHLPEKAAEKILLEYLKKPANPLLTKDLVVKKLARKLSLSHLKEISYPHWELAKDTRDFPYVQKLLDRYGYKTLIDKNGQLSYPQKIYFYGLVVHKDLKRAIQLLSDLDDVPTVDESDWQADSGLVPFIETLQTRFPRKDFSYLMANVVAGMSKPSQAAGLLRKLVSSSAFKRNQKLVLLGKVLDLDAMSGNLSALSRDIDAIDKLRTGPTDYDPAYRVIDTAVISGDRAFIDKMVDRSLKDPPGYPSDGLIQALLMTHRFGDLERIAISNCKENNPGTGPSEYGAKLLCDLYYRSGRPRDVLTVLRKFPNWDQSTLVLEDRRAGYSGGSSPEDARQPLGFYTAWAYAKTGREDLAIQCLRTLLLEKGENVACFKLLNNIGGKRCLAVYSELRDTYPYSNSTILWESDLLFRLGKVKQAWAGVQKAMAIDPIGDYPYREKLADLTRQILTKQGDAAGAARLANLLKAIQLGHRGEQLLRVSLLAQAEDAYSKAILLCPTDSALLAGLGDCLEEENRKPEARRHFLRALETISAAVGEATDDSSQVGKLLNLNELGASGQDILTKVIAKYPKNSAAYEARGMLNRACDRFADAATDFRQAFALDANRIDAIDSLILIVKKAHLTPKDAETLALKKIHLTLEIDGPYWFESLGMENIGDLSNVYQAIRSRLQEYPVSSCGPLIYLHSNGRNERLSIYPEFDRFSLQGRLAGRFFQFAKDVGEIARLYHTTRYPFE
jgi:Flp pilus assembly protein TadD